MTLTMHVSTEHVPNTDEWYINIILYERPNLANIHSLNENKKLNTSQYPRKQHFQVSQRFKQLRK